MKKVIIILVKIGICLLGSVFILAGLVGLIACFTEDQNLLVLDIIFTIIFFGLGIFLFVVNKLIGGKETSPSLNKNIQSPQNRPSDAVKCDTAMPVQNRTSAGQLGAAQLYNEHERPISGRQYIETDDGILRGDGKPFDDNDVPYLIQLSYEKAQQAENESANPKFHRSEKEEDFSYNFMMKYGHETSVFTDKFQNLYRNAYKTNDLSQRIDLLQEAIKAYEHAKGFCYSKGKGGIIYFQDMWEHMSNSQNTCYSYLDNIKRSLSESILERDTIIPGILNTVLENDGILQKDIYKELPNIDKSHIQRVIKTLESQGKIRRVKKSNSYELHIVK